MSSLFTNVLVNEAVQVICDRLQQDGMLEDRTTLSLDRVVDLLEMCLKSLYFCYRGGVLRATERGSNGLTCLCCGV